MKLDPWSRCLLDPGARCGLGHRDSGPDPFCQQPGLSSQRLISVVELLQWLVGIGRLSKAI